MLNSIKIYKNKSLSEILQSLKLKGAFFSPNFFDIIFKKSCVRSILDKFKVYNF